MFRENSQEKTSNGTLESSPYSTISADIRKSIVDVLSSIRLLSSAFLEQLRESKKNTGKNGKSINGQLTVYTTDIVERKNAENELRKLAQAVEQSSVSIVICDLNGNIEYVNPITTIKTGYLKEELIGKNPRIWSSGKKSSNEYASLWQTVKSGNIWQGEFHNKRKNGELYWEYATISPILDSEGNTTHLLAVKEDITEQKKLVSELYDAKARAEESDRLKTSFLRNISHEIRTPLNGIMGFANLLRKDDISKDEKEECIKFIQDSGNRLIEIVENIIAIAQIETKQIAIQTESFSINSMMNDLYSVFAPTSAAKGLILYCNNSLSDENCTIISDYLKLSQVLNNLIKNAIKFTLHGSVNFGYEIKNNEVQFYVKDTGIGIAAEHHEIIFERFIQAEISISRAYEGAGLGLAISKGLIELFNGKIWAESEVGMGSTFYFTITFTISD